MNLQTQAAAHRSLHPSSGGGATPGRLGVSALAIRLVLAGAEPEELVTAMFASAGHHPGIAAGDAIGANITMLNLVLGPACTWSQWE